MTTQDLVNAVILKATGKPTILSPGDTKYNKIVGIANGYIDFWQNEQNVDWNSLYEPEYNIGTITADSSYDLPDEVRKISDTRGDVIQVEKDGHVAKYDVVAADTLKRYGDGSRVCAQVGRSIIFSSGFEPDNPLLGGNLLVPCYVYSHYLVDPTDEVPVDIPRWLVTITAAEYVRNDITKQNQYPNLVSEANNLMERMRDDNDAQVNDAYYPYSVTRRSW